MKNEINPARIKWVKNIKAGKGSVFAYDNWKVDEEHNLHWPISKKKSAENPLKGEIIVLFQNYKNKGVILSHLVEVVDDEVLPDSDNAKDNPRFETAKRVKVLFRSETLKKNPSHDYGNVAFGAVHLISLLNKEEEMLKIQKDLLASFQNV